MWPEMEEQSPLRAAGSVHGALSTGLLHSSQWALRVLTADKQPACSSCQQILPVMSDKLENGKYKKWESTKPLETPSGWRGRDR